MKKLIVEEYPTLALVEKLAYITIYIIDSKLMIVNNSDFLGDATELNKDQIQLLIAELASIANDLN